MARWRVLLHATDRTGPPMLARALLAYLRDARPDVSVDIVAFRGGEMLSELGAFGPTTVLLDDHEPWDHDVPRPTRMSDLQTIGSTLPDVAAVLLVSVAAGQCLPYLGDLHAPVVTWVVEQGEDLHWLDPPVDVASRTDRWLAGSATTLDELRARMPGLEVAIAPEFVDPASAPSPPAVQERRAELHGARSGSLIVGAGIATWRKAPDLFLEAAVMSSRRGHDDTFVWVGGTNDPLHRLVASEIDRLGIENVVLAPTVDDLSSTFAAADLLLHTARLDAFPLVCLHAALLGTPVVAFAGAGGVTEMFGNTFRGAPYPDLNGLLDVVDALRSEHERRLAGQAQCDYVAQRYTSTVAAPTVIAAVDAVSGGAS